MPCRSGIIILQCLESGKCIPFMHGSDSLSSAFIVPRLLLHRVYDFVIWFAIIIVVVLCHMCLCMCVRCFYPMYRCYGRFLFVAVVISQMIRVLVLRHQNWLVMRWLLVGSVAIYVVFYGKFWSIQVVDHCIELVRLDKWTIQECWSGRRLQQIKWNEMELKMEKYTID